MVGLGEATAGSPYSTVPFFGAAYTAGRSTGALHRVYDPGIYWNTMRSHGKMFTVRDREAQQEKARNSQGFYISIEKRPALSS